jgi:hypothetical protein
VKTALEVSDGHSCKSELNEFNATEPST